MTNEIISNLIGVTKRWFVGGQNIREFDLDKSLLDQESNILLNDLKYKVDLFVKIFGNQINSIISNTDYFNTFKSSLGLILLPLNVDSNYNVDIIRNVQNKLKEEAPTLETLSVQDYYKSVMTSGLAAEIGPLWQERLNLERLNTDFIRKYSNSSYVGEDVLKQDDNRNEEISRRIRLLNNYPSEYDRYQADRQQADLLDLKIKYILQSFESRAVTK